MVSSIVAAISNRGGASVEASPISAAESRQAAAESRQSKSQPVSHCLLRIHQPAVECADSPLGTPRVSASTSTLSQAPRTVRQPSQRRNRPPAVQVNVRDIVFADIPYMIK